MDRGVSFLGVSALSGAEIEELLDLAEKFVEVLGRPIPKVPALRGKTVAMLFFEPSTRTRLSFERAVRALSADTMTFSSGTSSLAKGESLRDTVLTIEAMGPDALVVRHRAVGAPAQIGRWVEIPVVNAGDGAHQHPTQALLDAFTIRRHFGSVQGLVVSIVGDVRHSRVARSNVWSLTSLGASVNLVAPRTLLPPSLDGWPVQVTSDLDDVIEESDVVYVLRLQDERGAGDRYPSVPEYMARYGLSSERATRMRDGARVMHPGPMNRGVEIAPDVADGPRSLVTSQVASGVAVRMAVLFQILAGGPV